ncbi:glycosyltransferase family 2 protein [Halomonas sp. I5-271120]|uniref:glycosyltransferase family 2 protein n=1 Tax=Halomonas sp. I5-271120 TaxID=3061632 RepID=UPI002714FDAF|nr:glycosyltransferase family 2 protein [Halomonas sp. I5-271120]
MSSPEVSVIMPVYNSQEYISSAVSSVIDQSFHDWELIVVDDCSTDRSAEFLADFLAKDSRINLIKLKRNSGVATARNTAIEAASGRYIAFLDSDDVWLPCKLEKQVFFMKNNGVYLCYSAYSKIDEWDNFSGEVGVPEKVSYNDLLKTCHIGCLTAMYDSLMLGKVKMPTNTSREDFVTWLSILKEIDFSYGLNECLACYRVYKGQGSSNKILMSVGNWHVYRNIEGFSFFSSLYFFSNYAVRGLLRSKMPSVARRVGVLPDVQD